MSMQFLSATSDSLGYHYSVWLDTTQGTADNPNPAYVFNRDWAPAPMDPVTGACIWDTTQADGGLAAYQAMTITEVQALAQHHLDTIINRPTPQPIPLSVQGQTF